MNIFEAIRRDHEIQRDLLKKLVETAGKNDERIRLYQECKHQLKIHENAEERYFYTYLMEKDITQEKARHSVAEHHEIDELLEKLDKTEMTSSSWLVFAKELKHLVEHHLDEEEHEVFQLAGKALTEAQKISIAKEYNEMMIEQQ